MCGRFALGYPAKKIREDFTVSVDERYIPCFNCAPGRNILAVHDGIARCLRWGFVPHWANGPLPSPLINARSETVFEKPMFREAVLSARCLIPTQGFYEWEKVGKTRQPHYIRVKSEPYTTLAGIWSAYKDPVTGEIGETVAVLTCSANTLMKDIHDRMPVILPPAQWEAWGNSSRMNAAYLAAMLLPFPAEQMSAHPVSARVNNVINDDASLIKRASTASQLGLPLDNF